MSIADDTADCLPAVRRPGGHRRLAAARPLRPCDVGPFLDAVAEALRGREPGPGAVYRACREVQRQFFDPPGEPIAGHGSTA